MMSPSEAYELNIRQGPEKARVAGIKEKGILPNFIKHNREANDTHLMLL